MRHNVRGMTRLVALVLMLAGLLVSGPAHARVLRDLDFQTPGLLRPNGSPWQWENYVPGGPGTSGITLGSPGSLPFPYVQAARFDPAEPTGRPRSMAKLSRTSTADAGVLLSGPLDAAEGLERYYRWSTYFPEGYDLPARPIGAPSVFMAWHNDSSRSPCNTNVQLHAKRRKGDAVPHVLMRVQGGRFATTPPADFAAEGGTAASCYSETFREVDLGPVEPGRWTTFVVHTRWSSSPDAGVIEIARDGALTTVPGANLYRSADNVPETGVLEQGVYSPVDTSPAARERALWHVGLTIGDAPEDLRAPEGCRTLAGGVRRVRLGGRRVTVRLSRRASSTVPATLRLKGARGRSVSVGGVAYGLRRDRRATIPVEAFGAEGDHAVSVAVRGPRGPRRIRLTVRSAACQPL